MFTVYFEPFNHFYIFLHKDGIPFKTFQMFSLSWKKDFPKKKGAKRPKVGGAVGKNQLFYILLKIVSLDFF